MLNPPKKSQATHFRKKIVLKLGVAIGVRLGVPLPKKKVYGQNLKEIKNEIFFYDFNE